MYYVESVLLLPADNASALSLHSDKMYTGAAPMAGVSLRAGVLGVPDLAGESPD